MSPTFQEVLAEAEGKQDNNPENIKDFVSLFPEQILEDVLYNPFGEEYSIHFAYGIKKGTYPSGDFFGRVEYYEVDRNEEVLGMVVSVEGVSLKDVYNEEKYNPGNIETEIPWWGIKEGNEFVVTIKEQSKIQSYSSYLNKLLLENIDELKNGRIGMKILGVEGFAEGSEKDLERKVLFPVFFRDTKKEYTSAMKFLRSKKDSIDEYTRKNRKE